MGVKMDLEPRVDQWFHPDRYGYRPGKSSLEAIGVCRQRCWRYAWVVDLAIRGLFDNIDHSLMLRAVRKHTDGPWVLLHIERWLKSPAEAEEGTPIARERITPQGSVISPLLANIDLHYAFDLWVQQWRKTQARGDVIVVRYADDFIVGFQHRAEAEEDARASRKATRCC
jgi:RNA-directed DNA polymerase